MQTRWLASPSPKAWEPPGPLASARPLLPALRPSSRPTRSGDLLGYWRVRRYPCWNLKKRSGDQYQETGDLSSQRLFLNLRLVMKLAYSHQWANVLDLIQEGNVGLVEALSRYDPYRISTTATPIGSAR